MQRRLAFVFLLGVAACGGEDSISVPGACHPFAGGSCLLPWPSAVYLEEDSTTPTGYRLVVPPEAMPVNLDGARVDSATLSRYDGFSPDAVIVIAFDGGVSPEGLPPPEDVASSLEPDAPIVLLDMESMERVPYFAEVDLNFDNPRDRALLIRPVRRMRPATRHLVAIRESVKALDGGDLPRSEAFQALLDGRSVSHPLFGKLAARAPEVFAALEAIGVPKSDLVVAWDFITASDESLTRDLRVMRDVALARIDERLSTLTYEGVEKNDQVNPALSLRYIEGTFDSPIFLSDEEREESQLVRDADGNPVFQKFYRAEFAALVPRCAETATTKLPVVVFGHGLFGEAKGYLDGGLIQKVANENCAVFVGTDFIGLSSADFTTVVFSVNDLNLALRMVEKLPQGIVNFMALVRMMRGPLGQAPFFQVNGQSIIDPDRIYYFGASLGGIMGGVFMSYEPTIERGVLGVPGAPWSLLYERSLAWPALRSALQSAYQERFLYANLIAIMGFMMDPYDPITTAPYLIRDPMPLLGVPQKKIFVYATKDDSLVTNYATEVLARTMGLPLTMPSVWVPWGLAQTTEPVPSGLTLYDEHAMPKPPYGNLAPEEDNGTHSDVHERPAVQRQMIRFLYEGTLTHECRIAGNPAPCDCATGACE